MTDPGSEVPALNSTTEARRAEPWPFPSKWKLLRIPVVNKIAKSSKKLWSQNELISDNQVKLTNKSCVVDIISPLGPLELILKKKKKKVWFLKNFEDDLVSSNRIRVSSQILAALSLGKDNFRFFKKTHLNIWNVFFFSAQDKVFLFTGSSSLSFFFLSFYTNKDSKPSWVSLWFALF